MKDKMGLEDDKEEGPNSSTSHWRGGAERAKVIFYHALGLFFDEQL